jgi:tRNA-2-methylthio-N6-dimethylallyladenosine synthase
MPPKGWSRPTIRKKPTSSCSTPARCARKAQEKVFHDLGRVKHLKQLNPNLVIGVGGCVASQEGEAIVARAPYVDVVFGPQTLHRLPQLIAERKANGKAAVDVSFPEIEKFDSMPPAGVKGASAFVSIMEGCSKFCTFCIVPYTRGGEVSRPFNDVLTEVADLAANGVGKSPCSARTSMPTAATWKARKKRPTSRC